MMDKGRTDALKKKKKENDEMISSADRLKDMTRIRSGKFASSSHYHVGVDICDKVKRNFEAKRVKESVKHAKRAKVVDVNNEKYKIVMAKISEGEALRSKDYRTLMQQYKKPDDSPIKSRLSEVREQWNIDRVEWMLGMYLVTETQT
jgi:hypothetical protein